MKRISILVAVSVFLVCGVVSAGAIYNGSLSSATGGGLTTGGDGWSEAGFSVHWQVSENQDQTWHYSYTFKNEDGDPLVMAVSHFIISLSELIDPSDLMNFTASHLDGSGDPVAIPDVDVEMNMDTGYGFHVSNPKFPENSTIFGVKINIPEGDFSVVEFDSTRMPMWGDFYAKGGGFDKNYAYNVDLGVLVTNPHDYTGAVDSLGNPLHKILVPNTVPEPVSLLLLGLGGFIIRKRRA